MDLPEWAGSSESSGTRSSGSSSSSDGTRSSGSSSGGSPVSSAISFVPPPASPPQGMEEGASTAVVVVGEAGDVTSEPDSLPSSPQKRKEARGMVCTLRSGGLQVTLDNREVWERFHSWGTEMIVTKAGRRMFPYCRYKVRGLDPHSRYLMAIDVVPMEGHRYRWGEGCWMPVELGRPHLPDSIYLHQEGVAPGCFWMCDSISFSEVKLTNTSASQDGVIALTPMFKYVPRFHIVRASKVPRNLRLDTDDVHTFVFPQTEFFAVSVYQNTAITHLKISHGPLAWGAEPRPGASRKDGKGAGGAGSTLDVRQGAREGVSADQSGKRDRSRMVATDGRPRNAGRSDGSVGMSEGDVQSEKLTSVDGVKRNKLKRVDSFKVCNDQNSLFDINKVKEEPKNTWPEAEENVDPQSSQAKNGVPQVVPQKIPLENDCLSPPGSSVCTSDPVSKVEPAHAGEAMIVPTTVEQDKDVRCPASHRGARLPTQNLFPFVPLKRCSVTKTTVKLSDLPASVLYSYSFPRILLTRSACGDRPLAVLLSESSPHWSEPTDDVKPAKPRISEGNGLAALGVEHRREKSPSSSQKPLEKRPRLLNETFSDDDDTDVTPEDVKPTRSELDTELLNLTSAPKDAGESAPRAERASGHGSNKGAAPPSLKVGHTGFSSWVWTPPKEGDAAAFQLPPPSFSSVSSRSVSLCSRSRTPSPTPGSSQPRGRRAARGLAWDASAQRAATTTANRNPVGGRQADREDVEGVSFFSFPNKEALLAHRNMEQEKMETRCLSPTLSDNSTEHVSAGRAQERIQRLQDRLQSALSQFQKNKANDESGADPRFVSRTGKTNDVTKIKGWQHKFGIQAPASSSGNASAPDASTLGKNRSVFLSDKLDEYLQEEEKLLEQRPNMYASKAAGVTFQTPRTGCAYVRTLDSVLRRLGPVRFTGEMEAFAQCRNASSSPPPPPSGPRQKRGSLAGRRGKVRGKRCGRGGGRYARRGRGRLSSRGRGGGSDGWAETAAAVDDAPPLLVSPKKEPLLTTTPPKPVARMRPVGGGGMVRNANSRNVTTMLLSLEELALAGGMPRTFITADRAELALATLLTPEMTVTSTSMKKLSTNHLDRCHKEFCQLGCVCDSLGEGRAVPAHCGRPECMLECSCPPRAPGGSSLPASKQAGGADGAEAEGQPFGRHKRQKRLPTRLSSTHILYDDVGSDCYAFWKLTGRKGHRRKSEEPAENTEIPKKRLALWSDMDKSSQGKLDSASSSDVPATKTPSSQAKVLPTANELRKQQMEENVFALPAEGNYTCARVREYKSVKRQKPNVQCTCGKPHWVEKGFNKSNGKFNKEHKGISSKYEILETGRCKLSKVSKEEATGISTSGSLVRTIRAGSLGFVAGSAASIIPLISPPKQLMHRSGLPQSKLIEIVSDCNWESERTRVLSAIAEYSGGQSSGTTTTLQLGDLQLEISHMENKDRPSERRDPATTVSYMSGLPSHKCCSRVRITKNPRLSTASPVPKDDVDSNLNANGSGDGSSEEQCQEQDQPELNPPQSQVDQSVRVQKLQKKLMQEIHESEQLGRRSKHSNNELDLICHQQTEPRDAEKRQDEQLENQQQLQVARCSSTPQNRQAEHEPQGQVESDPPHLLEQQPEDEPKQRHSQPQLNSPQQNIDEQQNLAQQQAECKQEVEQDVPSVQELKSDEDAKTECSPPEKTIVPCSSVKVETPPAGPSAVSKGGTVNKTLFLTTAAAQAVFNSGAKGLNLIQMNGNFVPQAKLVVGQMGALPTMGLVEKQRGMVPMRNVTVHGHSPFLQVNGNMVTHTKLLVGQMGSLQAVGQNVGMPPFVSVVGGPSPAPNMAFHSTRRLVTTPLTPVSITLPDGSVAVPTSGSNPVTHVIVNKVGTLVAGQPLSTPATHAPTCLTGKSAAAGKPVTSGEATASPGPTDAAAGAASPEATEGSATSAGVSAADDPEAAGGPVTVSGGSATADKPVSAACDRAAAGDQVAAGGQPVAGGGDSVATGELVATGESSATDGPADSSGELEPDDRPAAIGETAADAKDLPLVPAGFAGAVVPVSMPITAAAPFPGGAAIPIGLSGGLQLPTGMPFVHRVSTEPQRLLFIPMQPPAVRPTATPATINPVRLPTPSPMLLPGQRMVLQPVKGTNRMQLYRHPSGQLVQLVPVRSGRSPGGEAAESSKPPTLTLRTGLVVHTLNPTGLGLQMRPTGPMLTVARTESPQVKEMTKEIKPDPEETWDPTKVKVKLENVQPNTAQAMPGGDQMQAEGDAVNPIVVQTSSSASADKGQDGEDSGSSKSGSVTTAARETAQSMEDESTDTSSDEESEVDVENLSEGEVSGISYTGQNMDLKTVDNTMKTKHSLPKTRMAQKESTHSQCALHNPGLNATSSNQRVSDSSDSDEDILKEVRPNRSGLMRSLQLQDLIALKLLNVPMDEFYDPKASLHTVNERRRRSELRDLFKNIQILLGFPAHAKLSKYALLKQAHSEIQHLQEQCDRMVAEKSSQLRRRDYLLRKVVTMTQKKEEVIIKKLEYICAKHRIKEKLKLTSSKELDRLKNLCLLPSNQPVKGRPRKIAPKPTLEQLSPLLARLFPPPQQPQPAQQTDAGPQVNTMSSCGPSASGQVQIQSEFEQQPREESRAQAESQPEARRSERRPRARSESPQPEPERQSQPQFQCEPQPQPEPQLQSHLPHHKPQREAAASASDRRATGPAFPMAPPAKPSIVRSRPLILTRKRAYSSEIDDVSSATSAGATWSSAFQKDGHLGDTPVLVTSDGLLMTPHGQVLTLKGKMVPSHSTAAGSPVIMAQGVLRGKPLAPKGQDRSKTGVPGIASVTIRLQCVNVPASGADAVGEALEHNNSSSGTVSTAANHGTGLVPSSLSAAPVCSPAATTSRQEAPAGGSSWLASRDEPDDKSRLDLTMTTRVIKRDDAEDCDDSELLKIVSVTSLADEGSSEHGAKGDAAPPFADRVSNTADFAHGNAASETVAVDGFSSLPLVMSSDTDATDEDNSDTSVDDAETKDPASPTPSCGGSTTKPSPSSSLESPEPVTSSASASEHGLGTVPSGCTATSTGTLTTRISFHGPSSQHATQLPSALPRPGRVSAASPRGTIPCSVRLPTLSLSQQALLALQATTKCVTKAAPSSRAGVSSAAPAMAAAAAPASPSVTPESPSAVAARSAALATGTKQDVRPMPQLLQMQLPKPLTNVPNLPRPPPPLSRIAMKQPARSPSPLGDATPAKRSCPD